MTKRKRLLVIIVVLSLVLPTISIVIGSAVGSLRNMIHEKNEQEVAIVLGEHIAELVQNEEIEKREIYITHERFSARYSVLSYRDDDMEKMVHDTRFVYAYVIDENVTLISRGADHQHVTGYLYVVEGELPEFYGVPNDLYFDGNWVRTEQISDHLYSYRAGI